MTTNNKLAEVEQAIHLACLHEFNDEDSALICKTVLPVISRLLDATHAYALRAAAREVRNNFIVGPHCLQDRILALTPGQSSALAALSRLQD